MAVFCRPFASACRSSVQEPLNAIHSVAKAGTDTKGYTRLNQALLVMADYGASETHTLQHAWCRRLNASFFVAC